MTDLTPEKDGNVVINFEDEVIRGATVVRAGEITFPPPAPKLSAAPAKKPEPATVAAPAPKIPSKFKPWIPFIIGALALLGLGLSHI